MGRKFSAATRSFESCASRASIWYFSMICCGVPRTLPSGPELSKTRLMMLPSERGRFALERERDLEDLILSFGPDDLGLFRTPSRVAVRAVALRACLA